MSDLTKDSSLSMRGLFVHVWELLEAGERRSVLVVLLLILIGTILEMMGVGLVLPLVSLLGQTNPQEGSDMIREIHDKLGRPDRQAFLGWVLGGLLSVFVVKNLFLIFSIWFQSRFLFGLQVRWSSKLVRVYLNRPYAYHLNHHSPELLQKTSGEVGTLVQTVLGSFIWLVSESFVVAGVLVLSILVTPTGTLWAVTGLGFALLGYYLIFRKKVETWGRQFKEHSQEMYRQLQNGYGGIKEVKIFGMEGHFSDTFTKHAQCMADYGRRHNFLVQSSRNVIEMFAVALLLFAVMMLVRKGGDTATVVPTMAFFAMAAFRLMPSVQRILSSLNNIRFGSRALFSLKADLQESQLSGVKETREHTPLKLNDKIFIEDLCFYYPNEKKAVIENANLTIPRGAMIGIQGTSGAGKTTLVDVVLGLLEPTRGKVLVDGKSIHANLQAWQANIGYVPQNIFLMEATLKENVAFGIPPERIDESRVLDALRKAQLDDLLQERSGLETMVGERGIRLSGGQRQRIGIARALYRDAEVLVLDEATASLDMETEAEFINVLLSQKKLKTIILISHRHSVMEGCDEVYEVTGGRVNLVRRGTLKGVEHSVS